MSRRVSSNCHKLLQGVFKLTLNAYIYKPFLAAIAGANDHRGLAGPTSRYRQSCENFENFFEHFLGKVKNFFFRRQGFS